MRRYSTIMSVLLTLALPVAATCAVPPSGHEKESPLEAVKEKPKASEGAAKAAQNTPKASETAPAGATSGKTAPAGHGSTGAASTAPAGHGSTTGSSTAPAGANVNPSGKVVETMNGGGYTYANLEKDGKQTWVAFPTLETRVGDTLSFSDCMEMSSFKSRALNRTFDSILFCGSPKVKPKSSVMSAQKSPGSSGAATSGNKKISVEKATGANAYTVAEIFAKREKLNGKQVVVRGQVVKVSSGIMNTNWIHLQDGTGTQKQKTHDLVVTSNELPNEGDVVTASGTVAKDKNFGSGYKYSVIIQKATIKK